MSAEGSGVRRYDIRSHGNGFPPDVLPRTAGAWVAYDDHDAALATLSAERDGLRNMLATSEAFHADALKEKEALSAERDALRLALQTIANMPDESDEWDGTVKYEQARIIAKDNLVALSQKEGM